jgi:hypothetical protein
VLQIVAKDTMDASSYCFFKGFHIQRRGRGRYPKRKRLILFK